LLVLDEQEKAPLWGEDINAAGVVDTVEAVLVRPLDRRDTRT
jgi:hypothetical protein